MIPETITLLVTIISLIVNIMLIVAVLRIFHISSTVDSILNAVKTADKNRRDEFKATVQEQ